MSYQALYRRYRPALFSDFVGQEAVIRTLKSQVMSGRIAHAYLFCGTRGTGKTSAAKVLARAVNCLSPIDGEPCGECEVCRALMQESSLDILEIDAASNNGVDEIRDLREKVKYPPQTGRYRVYIIDEVHMLSAGAFNALLKTLEEPPAHAVFILATTEPQKLPATILSRCQRFDFHRIPAEQIVRRLRVALDENGLQAEDAALSRIARAAEGGMRDAWSILDMCLGYAQEDGGGVTQALVVEVLGAADRDFLFRFVGALIDADAPRALGLIDEMMRKGREVQVFARDVSAHIRALMLSLVCGEEHAAQLLEVTREDACAYVDQAKSASQARLMRMLDLFLAAESDMKWAAQPRFALEAAALRACAPEESLQLEALIARVDELERRLSSVSSEAVLAAGRALATGAAGLGAPGNEGLAGVASAETAGLNAPGNAGNAGAGAGNSPRGTDGLGSTGFARQAAATEGKVSNGIQAPSEGRGEAPGYAEAERIWQEAVRRLKQNPMIYGIVRGGRLASCENAQFTVVFDKGTGAMYVRLLSMEDKNAQVAQALTAAAGFPCTFRAAIEGTVAESDSGVLAAKAQAQRQAQDNLDKIFGVFGRENVRVQDDE